MFVHGHRQSWHQRDFQETLDGIDWNKVTGYADVNREGVLWEIYPARYDSVAYKTLPEPIAEGEEAYSGKYPISAVSPYPSML